MNEKEQEALNKIVKAMQEQLAMGGVKFEQVRVYREMVDAITARVQLEKMIGEGK